MTTLLNLAAVPKSGMSFQMMDLDLTLECNMNCSYCFKEKRRGSMPERIAMDAVIWFLYSSGKNENINLNFMGGEPLLRWSLIKTLVPFAVRRAKEHGKILTASMTTNCTLISDEIIEFCHYWNVQFHSSIDGVEEIQNQSRPLKSGKPSFPIVMRGISKLLSMSARITARATVLPSNADSIFKNYLFFRESGYSSIALIPAERILWNHDHLKVYTEQMTLIAKDVIQCFRENKHVSVHGVNDHLRSAPDGKRNARPTCGAGRGMVTIDIDGKIWPCRRFTGLYEIDSACWGSIYGEFDNEKRQHNGRLYNYGKDGFLVLDSAGIQMTHISADDICTSLRIENGRMNFLVLAEYVWGILLIALFYPLALAMITLTILAPYLPF